MIESTFLHVPRVGRTTEQGLWRAGISTWHAFLEAPKVPRFTAGRKRSADHVLRASQRALASGESGFFNLVPSAEHWRLWPSFKDEAVYVDIETSWRGDITVLGIYDGRDVKQFVRGKNLTRQAVQEHLAGKIIVTYNGASFDLPIIRRFFGASVVPRVPHFDCMHLGRRLGYRGGLKALERSIGVRRPEELDGVTGADALHLWQLYRASGEEEHLKTLLAYNEEDIVNLECVAGKIVQEAVATLRKL